MANRSPPRTALCLLTALLAAHPLSLLATAGRQAAARNFTSLVVFGDSSVDPGNNNRLPTGMKANFPPYGVDFFGGRPTGRFTDGRLATDMIAEELGLTRMVPAFLDESTKPAELVHGVSFASAGSGFDEYTANLSRVLGLGKQLELMRHYKVQLRAAVGARRAEEVVEGAVFVLSMGTNDFIQNYYLEPLRPSQYSEEEYQNYLITRMADGIKGMRRLGARRLVVVGISPLGCMPLVKALRGESRCVGTYNRAALAFNSKARRRLPALRRALRLKIGFVDAYSLIQRAIDHPRAYGFKETGKGCCGSGQVELAAACGNQQACSEPGRYVFWDAVHPTQKVYRIIAEEVLAMLGRGSLI